jgi:hypothetical protein
MADNSIPAFVFGHSHNVRAPEAAQFQLPTIRRQMGAIERYVAENKLGTARPYVGVTGYRQGIFFRHQVFINLESVAAQRGTAVLVADLLSMLLSVGPSYQRDIVEDLDRLQADILNCANGKLWRELSLSERDEFAQQFENRRELSAAKAREFMRYASWKGSKTAQLRAERDAESYKQVIRSLKSQLPEGVELTPSILMHHLNNIGLKPPRANRWSRNSCKNLLLRLDKISGEIT